MKLVYIKAYYRQNVGDDMFVISLLKRYPDVKFIIFAHKKYTKSFIKSENAIILPMILYYLNRISQKIFKFSLIDAIIYICSDYVVHIGGSIFIETKDFKKILKNDLHHKNVFYIGANFGPFFTNEYYKLIKNKLSKSRDICFRDTYSYNMFNSLQNVRYAPDVLFGYKGYPELQTGYTVGLSLIDLQSREDMVSKNDIYFEGITKIIHHCISNNLKVVFFSFCNEEGDLKSIEKITRNYLDLKFEIYSYEGDLDIFLRNFNKCKYIVATRFHAMIIGWKLKKYVLPVIYSEKQLNVIQDIEFSGNYWNLLNSEILTEEKIGAFLNGVLSSMKLKNIENLGLESENQFLRFDQEIIEKRINKIVS